MITAGVLLLYAAVAGTRGAVWLWRARWTQRAPRLAILAWQALSLNVVVAVGLAGLALTFGLPHASLDLAALIDACATTLRGPFASPGAALGSAAGWAMLAMLTARLAWSTAITVRSDHRARRRTAATTDLVGRRDLLLGATVVEHDTAYAFCVPGHRSRIVLTSAAVAVLDDRQLRAVLAHEHAHLRGRHHLLLGLPRALAAAFPWVPALRLAESRTAILIELLADDSARRRVSSQALKEALGSLGGSLAPPAALAASALDVHRRILRLATPLTPLRGLPRLLAVASISAALAAPAAAAAAEGWCLIF